jgi:hypothetical protein
MKDFKKMPKMACGGKVAKYETGGEVRHKFKKYDPTALTAKKEAYQDTPDYYGYEDATPVGEKAGAAATKAYREGKIDQMGKAAQSVIQKDREQRKPFEKANPMGDTYKRGGKITKKKK